MFSVTLLREANSKASANVLTLLREAIVEANANVLSHC